MKSWNDWNGVPDNLDDMDDMDDMDHVDDMDESGELDDAARQETSFPDPWDGDHDIEYWVWSGDQLVPATPSQQAEIQEVERIASARRLRRWHNESEQHTTMRTRIVRGMRQPIASFRHMLRHETWPSVASNEAHNAATSAHRRDGES